MQSPLYCTDGEIRGFLDSIYYYNMQITILQVETCVHGLKNLFKQQLTVVQNTHSWILQAFFRDPKNLQ